MSKFLAKEGYFVVFLSLFLFLTFWFFAEFSWMLFILFLLLAFLFRKTKNAPPCSDEKAILSPLSGKITQIENTTHKDLGACVVLRIKNALYDCGVLIAPTKMRIENSQLTHGLFLCDRLEAAKTMNEKITLQSSASGQKFILQIHAGSMDRKLKFAPLNQTLSCGDELGFSLNGSVSLFLPRDARVHVGLNDTIKAGSLLGYFA